MIYWAQLLHFYQPPTQFPPVLRKICDESYRPLIEVFRKHPDARATVNINGVLTDMLQDYGHGDVIQGLKELAEKGQIEFTGSGKYHPILPLIPFEETERQISLNLKTNALFFGDSYRPRGFFPPEMAYSREILPSVIDSGHQWIILSGVACPSKWPVDSIYQVASKDKRISVFFRDDILSNKISFNELGPKEFLEHLKSLGGNGNNVYVVTAMDAETYGHHIQQWETLFLAEVYKQIEGGKETYGDIKQKKDLADQTTSLIQDVEAAPEIQTATISQLLELFPTGELVDPKASSWSTSGQDIEAGNPYPLWSDKDNEIHLLQWEHMAICLEMCSMATRVASNDESKHFAIIARGLLDRALHSCQFWWASRRPMWDINLIHMGLIEQWRVIVNAYRAINKSGAKAAIKREYYHKSIAARDVRGKIVDRLFSY